MYNGGSRSESAISLSRRMARTEKASDEALIERIARGDAQAMRLFFARHQIGVYRFARRLLDDHGTAEDVTSEVFLSVWRGADGFRGHSSASTWLLAIARYKAISAARRRPDSILDECFSSIEDPSDDPEIAVQKKGRSEIIRGCLQRLSPKHREIVDLVYYHGKSIREVAEIVEAPESTVKTRMFYARQKLSQLLEAAGVDGAHP